MLFFTALLLLSIILISIIFMLAKQLITNDQLNKTLLSISVFVLIITTLLLIYGTSNKTTVPDESSKRALITETPPAKINSEQPKVVEYDGTLKIGLSTEVAPYVYINKNTSKVEGLEIDILERIAKNINYNVEYMFIQPNLIDDYLLDNNIDIMIGGIRSNTNSNNTVDFSNSYLSSKLVFFSNFREHSTLFNYNSNSNIIKALARQSVGGLLNKDEFSYITEIFSKHNIIIKSYRTSNEILIDVENNLTTVALLDETLLNYYLQNNSSSNLVVLNIVLSNNISDIAFKIKSKSQLKYVLNEQLTLLKNTGFLDTLYAKYNIYK